MTKPTSAEMLQWRLGRFRATMDDRDAEWTISLGRPSHGPPVYDVIALRFYTGPDADDGEPLIADYTSHHAPTMEECLDRVTDTVAGWGDRE